MLIVAVYVLLMKNAVRIIFKKNQFSFCKTTARQIRPLAVGSPLPERNLCFERSKKNKKKHLLNHFFANHGRYLAADDSSKPTTTTVLMSRFLANHL